MASSRSSPPAEPGAAGPASPAPPARPGRRATPAAPGSDPVTAAVRAGARRSPPVGRTRPAGRRASPWRCRAAAIRWCCSMRSPGLRAELPVTVSAVHVHHGLSPNADGWAAFCAAECDQRGVALALRRVQVQRAPGDSLEAIARADTLFRARDRRRRCRRARPPCRRSGGNAAAAIAARRRAARSRRDAGRARSRRPAAHPAAARAAARRSSRPTRGSTTSPGSTTNPMPTRACAAISCATRSPRGSPPRSPAIRRRSCAPPPTTPRPRDLLDELAALDADAALPPAPAMRRSRRSTARRWRRWRSARRRARAISCAGFCAATGCRRRRPRVSRRCCDQLVHAAPDARVRVAHAGVELGIFRGRIVVHASAVRAVRRRLVGRAGTRAAARRSRIRSGRAARASRRACWRRRRSPCAGAKAASACASRSTGRAAPSGGCSMTRASRRGSAHRSRSSGAARRWRRFPGSASTPPCAQPPNDPGIVLHWHPRHAR